VRAGDVQARFYTLLLEAFARRGAAQVYRYRFDERVVAMDLCVESHDCIVVLKTAYDESVPAHFSPAREAGLTIAITSFSYRRGLPRDGYVLTLIGEREWNNSRGDYGADGFTTELPSAVWRARGRLDWYLPASDSVCWEIYGAGGWQDDKDRLQNTDSQRPLGSIWADAQLRLRIHLGQSFTLTPYFQGQYSRLVGQDGFSTTKDFFLGGGVDSYLHFSDTVSLQAWYSYLDNDNRPSIRIDRDVHGEQMFYLGMVLRFGGSAATVAAAAAVTLGEADGERLPAEPRDVWRFCAIVAAVAP
jgi:hypothetical protein